MRLTKYQKARLIEYEWDVIESEVDGKIQNCSWVSIDPSDGAIFQEVVNHFGLTGDGEDVKLLVIATSEN